MIQELLSAKKKDPIKIGSALYHMRENIDHGHWASALKVQVGISPRTAERYINVYRRFKNGLDVNLKASVLYSLSKPSTPDAVVEQVLRLAREGKDITPDQVDKMAEDLGSLQVKLTPGQRIMRSLKEAETGIRKASTLSCMEREDIEASCHKIVDWMYAPES